MDSKHSPRYFYEEVVRPSPRRSPTRTSACDRFAVRVAELGGIDQMDSCAHARESPHTPPQGILQPRSAGYDVARWDLAPVLDRLVSDAVGLVGVEAVGLIVADGRGRLAMVAASDRRTMRIQQLQL